MGLGCAMLGGGRWLGLAGGLGLGLGLSPWRCGDVARWEGGVNTCFGEGVVSDRREAGMGRGYGMVWNGR